MKIAVLANGEWDSEWGRSELQNVDFLVCADGGANSAHRSGRLPDALIGDLDSVNEEVLQEYQESGVKIERYPREKDQTDLELALQLAFRQAERVGESVIWLYGSTGGRIDHFLGNLALLLAAERQGKCLRMKDPRHEMWIIRGRESLQGRKGQELSLIPLSERAVVTTEGLYYPLDHHVLFQDSPRGISNVFTGEEASVQVDEGFVLVVVLTETV